MDSWWREDFVALEKKLVEALGRKQQGQRPVSLPPCAFYDLNVLAFHPQQLCDEYKNPAGDAAHVYFFSPRDLPSDGGETRPPGTTVTVDGGTWRFCDRGLVTATDGRIIGHKTTFDLYIKGSDTRSEWSMDEFNTLGPDDIDLCLRRVYKRDKRWKDEERRRQNSPWPVMRERLLLQLRTSFASAPALLEKKERELEVAWARYWNQ